MPLLQGAFWISDGHHRKYLNVDAGGIVGGAALGPRGIDLLNSVELRTQIWLVEKAADGKNFRFRNYETGTALDVQDSGHRTPVAVTSGNSQNQVWEVNWLENSAYDRGAMYQIKSLHTSKVLDQTSSGAVVSQKPHDGSNQAWLFEPVLLPTLYWLTNLAAPTSVLRASDRPNASDNTSGGVALVSKELSARNQLWTFEYTSVSECILRSASHNQFVLDLSDEDSQTLLVRKHHGGPNQRWMVKDEDENNYIVSLANVKTNTLLATRKQQLIGGPALDTLAVVIEGNTRWQIHPSPQPPCFWVTIQNLRTGAFLAQAADGSIVPSMGALHANDHTVQWRFIMLGKDPRYAIINRSTGFVLDHHARANSGVSIVAEDDDRSDVNHQWILESVGDSVVGIVNVGSNCALDHWGGKEIQAYSPGTDNENRQWVIMPLYDTLPSFALVNLHTGHCITNNPNPNAGTAVTTDDINDFRSQWLFYHPVGNIKSDPEYVLLNKMSGNVLEHYKGARIEAHDNSHSDRHQKWKLVPLRERFFALVNAATQQFLYDPGEYNPMTDGPLPEDIRVLCWYLVSHRESGFDFVSWDFDVLQRLLPYITSQAGEELRRVITRRLPVGEKMKGKEKYTHIPRVTRITRITNDTLRVILARLIEQWVDDSIPETSQPRTIVSTNRREVEQQWKIYLSERLLRRRSDEPGWIRIDLQGVYNVDGNLLANIQGQWLEASVFQVIIPAKLHVGRSMIQWAMVQSLTEGLTVEIRVTPPTHTPTASKGKRLSTTSRPPGPGAGDGGVNSIALTLGLIPIGSLMHDEL